MHVTQNGAWIQHIFAEFDLIWVLVLNAVEENRKFGEQSNIWYDTEHETLSSKTWFLLP